tara:strand:- start:23351 stop:24100 length:750 start_codon:yes stop_codon:yes gene_type:complete
LSIKEKFKKTIKQLASNFLLKKLYHKTNYYYKFIFLKYFSGSVSSIFEDIYKNKRWGENNISVSGPGSENAQTKIIIKKIPEVLEKYSIKNILDIPCGDFNWMKEIRLDGISYIGADIVTDIVNTNIDSYQSENISFVKLNIIEDDLPEVDMIFCRDCLVHFSNQDLFKALRNIASSKSRYLLTTNFSNRKKNIDIATGMWRPLNLKKAPFFLPAPIEVMNEGCTEGDGDFKDKELAIWEINSLKSFLN